MKKAIVTGATGFVGTHLVAELLSSGVEAVALVRPGEETAGLFSQSPHLQLVTGSLDQLTGLVDERLSGADTFYHLAWAGVSGNGRGDFTTQFDNARYAVDAVRLANQVGCRRFIGAGSIMENETYWTSKKQGSPMNQSYIYGAAKFLGRVASQAIANELAVEHLWVMITNAYGVGENSPRFINTTLRKIIRGEKLEFTAATQNYDFVYVDDVARAFRLIGEHGQANHHYLIGSGQARELRWFIERLVQTVAPHQRLHFGDVPYHGANLDLREFAIDELVRDTGFEITVPFEQGIKKTYQWLKQTESNRDVAV